MPCLLQPMALAFWPLPAAWPPSKPHLFQEPCVSLPGVAQLRGPGVTCAIPNTGVGRGCSTTLWLELLLCPKKEGKGAVRAPILSSRCANHTGLKGNSRRRKSKSESTAYRCLFWPQPFLSSSACPAPSKLPHSPQGPTKPSSSQILLCEWFHFIWYCLFSWIFHY